MKIDWDKLKHEWKTFVVAVSATAVGAWQLAIAWGANLADLTQYIPEQYRSVVLFGFGVAMLLLRKYTDQQDADV